MVGVAPRAPLPLLLLLPLCGLGAELTLSAVPSKLATVGSDALLECAFKVRSLPIDLQYLGILWSFQDQDLLLLSDGKQKALHPRVSINESEIPKGTASLMLANVTTSDEGEYTCSVIYTPNKEEKTITLSVQAQPEIIIPEQVVIRGKENLLRCSVVGFYPAQIDAFWLRDGTPLPGSSMTKPLRNPNGTYTINTTVPLTPTDADVSLNLSCAVSHKSLRRTLQKQVPLSITEDTVQNGIVVTAVVVSLIVVFIVAALGCFWYRRKLHVEVRVCDIQGPDTWILGETIALVIVGHICRKNTETRWTKRCRGTEAEIEVGSSSVHQDRMPLLDRDHYRDEISKASENDGRYTITCTLHIAVSLEDEGAVFKCRVSTKNQKISAEKEFKDFRVCGKPEAQGIHCSPFDGEHVRCTLNLMRVYPEEIEIIWFVGVGKLQETPSEDHVTRTSDQGTVDIRSECVLPEENFADQKFKIIVTWSHVSMLSPKYKEMSVTSPDFPGRPMLEDITVPLLFNGEESSLSYRVSHYFPKEIEVTWWKTQKGSNEPVLVSDGNGMRHLTEQPLEKGVGYSCTALLSFIPDSDKEHELEFICQVSHPSLREPLRKHTPKMIIMEKN